MVTRSVLSKLILNPALCAALCLAPTLHAQPGASIQDFSFELEALGGGTIRAEDYRDKVLIVDFWGTWCPPCRAALPGMLQLYGKYKHYGLEIVGLNYENAADAAAAKDLVRRFAAEFGITYQLALGTEEVQRQVPGFSGYPTMLLFKRGLVHDRTVVGYVPGKEKELEAWIRRALGLEGGGADAPGELPAAKASEPELVEQVPDGMIYRPGNGDRGFGFELEDTEGRKLRFEDLRGTPVVLAVTSTWDAEAEETARFLTRIRARFADRAAVLAAHIEMDSDPASKLAAIAAFRQRTGVSYRILPVDLSFTRLRIHKFAGLPMLLVFDADGTLTLRETGSSPAIQALVVNAVESLLDR